MKQLVMVDNDYVREMTVKKSGKYGEHGSFEYLPFLFWDENHYLSQMQLVLCCNTTFVSSHYCFDSIFYSACMPIACECFVSMSCLSKCSYRLYCLSVENRKHMVGSYGPKSELHVYHTPKEDAPSGMLARGDYKVQSCFTDDDKNIFLEWEWNLTIKKAVE